MASDAQADDRFGVSVSISGDTLVVGAPVESTGGTGAGAAYVFERNQGGTDTWGQMAKLMASDAQAHDEFGCAVSISGDTLVVGAYLEDTGGNDAGAAYTFVLEPFADLSITKTVTPASAAPGDAITYTLVFSNAGINTASGVVITDSIPVSVTGASVISSGVAIEQVSARYAWEVASLVPGESGIITVTGVLSNPLAAGVFTNTATIASTAIDSAPENNSSSQDVTAQNVAPVAADDAYTTTEDTPLTVSALGVLDNDYDANGDPLTAVLDHDAATGTLALGSDGSFVYTPTLDYNGVVTFSYHASDTISDSNTARVTIAVSARNDAPTISNIADRSADAGAPISVTFIISDTDDALEGLWLYAESSNLALVNGGLSGTLMLGDGISFSPSTGSGQSGSGTDRTATITPTAGMTGTTTITITVDDGELSDSDSFVLAVGVNAPPGFDSSPALTATIGVVYTYDVTATDPDVGDTLVITATTLPGWLTLSDHGDGTATLTGTPTTADTYDVVLEVSDGEASDTQSFTITVEEVEPASYIYLPLIMRAGP